MLGAVYSEVKYMDFTDIAKVPDATLHRSLLHTLDILKSSQPCPRRLICHPEPCDNTYTLHLIQRFKPRSPASQS